LLWALAKLRHHPGETLLVAILDRLKEAAPELPPKAAALAVWCVATLGLTMYKAELREVVEGSIAQVRLSSWCVGGGKGRVGASM